MTSFSKFAVVAIVATFSSFARAESCVSESGARVIVDGVQIKSIDGALVVRGQNGQTSAVLSVRQGEFALSPGCESGVMAMFEDSSSSVLAFCSGPTGVETFSTALMCK